MQRAVFLDKDGTLVVDIPYNTDPEKIELAPFAVEALKQLQDHGYLLIVVSNQSGISKGYFTAAALKPVITRIGRLLCPAGITLHDFYYCPHHENDACDCRKPKPGMLLQAARAHQIDLAHSWMIGDILNDVEAGKKAGCQTVLINNGNETEWLLTADRKPTFIANDLKEAAELILLSKSYE
jgi:histidinol-phosphate phosphatase family domain/HAD-superfamily hydrolase, subfamily IIIA